ncbi:unnamed protein product, partial [Allacma fusca]
VMNWRILKSKMSEKLIVGALTLALLSTAMARSVNRTKEERAGGAFSHNGNSQGGVITVGQWIFSGANFPWHFNPFSGFSPPGQAPANSNQLVHETIIIAVKNTFCLCNHCKFVLSYNLSNAGLTDLFLRDNSLRNDPWDVDRIRDQWKAEWKYETTDLRDGKIVFTLGRLSYKTYPNILAKLMMTDLMNKT